MYIIVNPQYMDRILSIAMLTSAKHTEGNETQFLPNCKVEQVWDGSFLSFATLTSVIVQEDGGHSY